ncbi:MAG: hypothetical protein ACRC1T_09145 [Clostridium chrysemydis]|uniref:hypothetical protein n=1 Tax=Clostridium chrysemydis TaxID=2665504 RepID=UPI003F2AB173
MLAELLRKRQNNEDLTEDELRILKEYDDSLAVHMSELERIKAEKEVAEKELSKTNNELKEKSTALTEKEELLKKELEEKESIKKILENTTSTQEARLKIEKTKLEQKQQEELRKIEKEKEEAEKKKESDNLALKEELEKLKSELAKGKFEKKIYAEKVKRPYLEKQLDVIIADIETSKIEELELALGYLLKAYNHDEEMAKWNVKQKAGSSVFEKQNTVLTDKVETKKTPQQIKEEEFRKKFGFKKR